MDEHGRRFWLLFWAFWVPISLVLLSSGAAIGAGVVVTVGLLFLFLTGRGRRAERRRYRGRDYYE